jgi:dihydrofolate reductase
MIIRRVTHAENHRQRPGFHGWRHAGAGRTDRGSDQGFQFGGWSMPYFDLEFGEELDRLFSEKFDLLLGRKTYEIFAAYWPHYDEGAPHGGIAKLFNQIKKYAVSRSGVVDTSWQGSAVLRDIADTKRLRDEDGPDLVTQGSTELVHARTVGCWRKRNSLRA